ncbi:hypothetical protein YC2023_030357 [Brassica napus]
MEKEVAMKENASSWIQSQISLRGEQRVRHRGVVHEERSYACGRDNYISLFNKEHGFICEVDDHCENCQTLHIDVAP